MLYVHLLVQVEEEIEALLLTAKLMKQGINLFKKEQEATLIVEKWRRRWKIIPTRYLPLTIIVDFSYWKSFQKI